MIAKEMVETERNYVAALRTLVDVCDFCDVNNPAQEVKPQYLKALESNPKPTDKEKDLVATVFANSDKILAQNEAFLKGLLVHMCHRS